MQYVSTGLSQRPIAARLCVRRFLRPSAATIGRTGRTKKWAKAHAKRLPPRWHGWQGGPAQQIRTGVPSPLSSSAQPQCNHNRNGFNDTSSLSTENIRKILAPNEKYVISVESDQKTGFVPFAAHGDVKMKKKLGTLLMAVAVAGTLITAPAMAWAPHGDWGHGRGGWYGRPWREGPWHPEYGNRGYRGPYWANGYGPGWEYGRWGHRDFDDDWHGRWGEHHRWGEHRRWGDDD